MELWKIIVLFGAALLGGLLIFAIRPGATSLFKLVLSFSGSFLFGVTALHLLPEVYEGGSRLQAGVCIIAGFLFQIVVEQFSEGVEHGHLHHQTHKNLFPFGIMVSLCLHAFLEGMPLAKDAHNQLIFGISLHHIPAAFALAGILMHNKISRPVLITSLVAFAAMAPLGYYFSLVISHSTGAGIARYFNNIMAFVIGIFLHISTTILFETGTNHKVNLKKFIAILLGFGLAIAGFAGAETNHAHQHVLSAPGHPARVKHFGYVSSPNGAYPRRQLI